ncbi:MAG: hypothetical protein IK048_01060 [Clostridia bacterium]|nr:hypothetical protein [Clostridia bacterium]
MYTRCPSCRAQISFELPQSADSFPEGYKHKIKCPSCGVTIGVKIPRVDTTATVQPTYTPANPAASEFEPTYQAAPPVPMDPKEEKKAAKKAKAAEKKSGLPRNIFMMIFSLLFVALSTVAYLLKNGTIPEGSLPPWMGGIASFDGISLFEGLINKTFVQPSDALGWIPAVLPSALFVLSGIVFIVALIGAIGKKYARAWNFLASLIVFAIAVVMLLAPGIFEEGNFVELIMVYFMGEHGIITSGAYFAFAGVALGLLQLLFSLFFCASMKKKVK